MGKNHTPSSFLSALGVQSWMSVNYLYQLAYIWYMENCQEKKYLAVNLVWVTFHERLQLYIMYVMFEKFHLNEKKIC